MKTVVCYLKFIVMGLRLPKISTFILVINYLSVSTMHINRLQGVAVGP